MEFLYFYGTGALVTFAFLLYLNQKEGFDVLEGGRELRDPTDYYDKDGDSAALIIGALFGSIMWPLTMGVFIYYKYFDNNEH